jgi:hypothetical protein
MTPKLSAEQRQALDEYPGRPITVIDADRGQRFLLIPETDHRVRALLENSNGDETWTDEKEARRRELIDNDIAGTLTPDERTELALLDWQGNSHYDKVAPRPLEGVRQLHQQILDKRDNQ